MATKAKAVAKKTKKVLTPKQELKLLRRENNKLIRESNAKTKDAVRTFENVHELERQLFDLRTEKAHVDHELATCQASNRGLLDTNASLTAEVDGFRRAWHEANDANRQLENAVQRLTAETALLKDRVKLLEERAKQAEHMMQMGIRTAVRGAIAEAHSIGEMTGYSEALEHNE